MESADHVEVRNQRREEEDVAEDPQRNQRREEVEEDEDPQRSLRREEEDVAEDPQRNQRREEDEDDDDHTRRVEIRVVEAKVVEDIDEEEARVEEDVNIIKYFNCK